MEGWGVRKGIWEKGGRVEGRSSQVRLGGSGWNGWRD